METKTLLECPNCNKQYQIGELFCSACGLYLILSGPLGTNPLPESELPAAPANADDQIDEASASKALADEAGQNNISIFIVSTGREVTFPNDRTVFLGRLDPAHGVFPDVDLSFEGGKKSGVSRRHARIQHQESHFFVEDLGSSNGTYLNGRRLTPYVPCPLHNGDELQLGQVQLRIDV